MMGIVFIYFCILVVGLGLFYLALRLAEKALSRRVAVSVIFKDFRKKMWMTAGLGILFFGFYLFIVCLARMLIDSNTRLDLFFLLHQYPITFIYLGLLIFITISVSIYLVRLGIKYLYNKRNQE